MQTENFTEMKQSKIINLTHFPAENYILKVNNRNTRTRCEICSKLIVKTPERRQWPCSDLVLVFLLLTLNMKSSAGLKLPNR